MGHLAAEAALRVKREQHGMSARALSAALGKSPSYVSKVESGDITLSLNGFAEIARKLELTNAEILWVIHQSAKGTNRHDG